MSNTFTIKAEYERGGTTYYVKKSGSACDAVSTTSPAEECTDSLTQFNQAGNCDGEYLGARFSGGSLNGYLMRASDLDKRDGVADDDGSGGCSNVDRLVGVMELNTPVTLNSGQAYLAVVGTFSSDMSVANAGTTDAQTSFLFREDDQTWYYTLNVPYVRLNFDPTISIEENNILNDT